MKLNKNELAMVAENISAYITLFATTKKKMQTWKLFYIWNNGKKQILNFNSIKFIFKMWIQYDFYDDDDSQFFCMHIEKR